MPINPLETRIIVKTDEADRTVDQFARDNGKKLDKLRVIELEAETADLDLELFKLRKQLSEIKKEGKDGVLDEAEFKRVSTEIRKVSSNLTESKRRLQNLRNTGDETTSRLQAKFDGLGASVKRLGVQLLGVFSIREVGRGVSDLADTFDSFESGFAGFRKTLDATESELQNIEQGILSLSKTIPLTTEELSKIAETGGQFGIAAQDILIFTETVARLSSAIDGVSAEEAAKQLSRVLALTGDSIQNIDKLGSSLVQLGNNFKANEGEILNFAERIAGVGGIVDISSAQILGIATAFVDVGIQAEAGGTSVQKALLDINSAVNDGSSDLQGFASIAGLSAEEFTKLWNDDAAAGFSAFIEGLGTAGDDADKILSELIGDNARVKRAFLSAAQSGGVLTKAISDSSAEFENSTALNEEFEKRLNTNTAQLAIQANQWRLWKADLGESVADSRVALGEFGLKFVPGVFAQMQLQIIGGVVNLKKLGLAFQGLFFIGKGALALLGATVVDIFKSIANNGSILVFNLKQAFSSFPNVFQSIGVIVAKGFEKLLNIPVKGINELLGLLNKIPGVAGNIPSQLGKIKLSGFIDVPGATADFKAFEKIQSDTRNIVGEGFSEEIQGIKDRNRILDESLKISEARLLKQGNLATDYREQAESEESSKIRAEIEGENEALENYIDNLGEKEKAKGGSTKKINDLQKQEEKAVDDFEKSAKSNYQEVGKAVDEVTKEIEDQESELQKLKDEYSELKQSAVEDIRGIKNELSTLDTQEDTELAERRLEILERQAEIGDKIADLRNSDDEDRSSQINALREEETRLASEISLIESEVTQEILDQVEAYDKLSETQKILADNAKERAKIEEELLLSQLVAEGREGEITIGTNEDGSLRAFITDAEGIITEFTEFENIERAKSILADAQKRELEIANLEASIQTQTILQQDLINNLRFIEENYTSFIQDEYSKRTSAARDYATNTIDAIKRIQDAARDANISIPSTSGTSSTSGGDTTNNITNNIEVNNATAGAAQVSTDTLLTNINTP